MLIKIKNDQPTGRPLEIPKKFSNINSPTLDQMLSFSFAEYIEAEVFDPATHRLGGFVPAGEAWTSEIVERDLVEIKTDRKYIILEKFDFAETIPVLVDGVNYWADVMSALRLDGARRAVIESIDAGVLPAGSKVALTDCERVKHELTQAEALAVCLGVAAAAQVDFANKQEKLVAIREAATADQVLAVVW